MQVPYTEEAYFKLGRNVTRTFLDFYKLDSTVTRKSTFQRRPAEMKPKRFSEDDSSESDQQQSASEMDDSLTQLNSQTSSSSIDSSGMASLKLTHRKSK